MAATNSNIFLNNYMHTLSKDNKKVLSPLSSSKLNSSSNLQSPRNLKSPIDGKGSLVAKSPMSLKLDASPLLKTEEKLSKVNLNGFTKEELKYYEFLCRVAEVKRWMEDVIGSELPSELELCTGDSLRNGVYLATLAQRINPQLVPSIFPAGDKLQFKHTQNINMFFSLVGHVGVPESFRFELQDLYNKKDLPQVFETLHILISIINKKWPQKTPQVQNMSGQAVFTKEDLRKCKRVWPRIRDFRSLATSPIASPKAKLNKPALIENFDTFEETITPSDVFQVPTTPTKRSTIAKTHYMSPTMIKTPASASDDTQLRPGFKAVDADIIANTPHLEYSPLKLMSMSYHSPSISSYLNEDIDFYLQRSKSRTSGLQYYPTYSYSPSHYSPKRRSRMDEDQFKEQVCAIQSHCRGVNLRFKLKMQTTLLELFGRDIISLQAHALGHLKRTSLKLLTLKVHLPAYLVELQSFLKGQLMRQKYDILRIKYMRNERRIKILQAIARGSIVRRNIHVKLADRQIYFAPLVKLQALIKAQRLRKQLECKVQITDIINLQRFFRGSLFRKRFLARRNSIIESGTEVVFAKLQSLLRGSQIRLEISQKQAAIAKYSSIVQTFSVLITAAQVRKKVRALILEGDDKSHNICILQAYTRGILVRYALDLVDDYVEYHNLHALQAQLRGCLVRKVIRKRYAYFQVNKRSIICIQSSIRAYQQRKAFVDILMHPNPSLKSVRKFVHLLNDCGTIEDIQDQLESTQASLDAANMKREKLEREIRQNLDLVDVLEKYRLCTGIPDAFNHVSIPMAKYPVYEKLFYLLQVDSAYWRTIFEKEPMFVKTNVYVTFTTVNQRMAARERKYFVRLITDILQNEVLKSATLSSFLENNSHHWQHFLSSFLQREYPEIFALFLPVLEYLSRSDISFESDPNIIYESLHGNSFRGSNKVAIDDSLTKDTFIKNLQNLWHAIEMVANVFTGATSKIPMEIKYLAAKCFGYIADNNGNEAFSLMGVSKVLIKTFVNEYLSNRRYYGFEDPERCFMHKKVEILLGALSTVFEFGAFGGYYEPLNQYCTEMRPYLKDLLYQMISTAEYEQELNKLLYNDMISSRPTLEILVDKVLIIARKFQEYATFFDEDDIITDVLKQCAEDKTIPSTGRIVLELDTASYRFLSIDDHTQKIYDQVKRSLVYMMQIEDVDSTLYDLIISEVLPEDEPAFEKLINSNRHISQDPVVRTLQRPRYFNLKNDALRKVHELESSGVINASQSKLQNILNDIANTIKNPRYAVDHVRHELDATAFCAKNVSSSNQDLTSLLRKITDYVDAIISDLQRSHTYGPAHRSALGNLKDVYKKTQSKNGNGQDGLKLKWSTRQLYEKGVIKYIKGERLGEQTVKVFGSSGPKFPDIVFKVSTSDGVRFGIQLSDKRKGPSRRYSEKVDSFKFIDLLNTQVGSKQETWSLFDGKVTFKTSQLLTLIATNFFNRSTYV